MDCSKYRTCGKQKRLKSALKMKDNFLVDGSSGRTNQASSLALCRILVGASANSAGSRGSVLYRRQTGAAPVVMPAVVGSPVLVHLQSRTAPITTADRIYTVEAGSENGRAGNVSDNAINGAENAIGVYGNSLAEVLHVITEALIDDQALGTLSEEGSRQESTGSVFNPVPQFNISAGQRRVDSVPAPIARLNNPNPNQQPLGLLQPQPQLFSAFCTDEMDSSSSEHQQSIRSVLTQRGIVLGNNTISSDAAPQYLPNTLFDTLDKIVFNRLHDILWDDFQKSEEWDTYWQFRWIALQPVQEEDFALFRVLGRGAFGTVYMCKRTQSGKIFAVKIMNKKRVKMKNSVNSAIKERNLMICIDSPYVVCLRFAFTTQQDLYLGFDLMMGGDMKHHLTRKACFGLSETKYFAARILMGVMALHDKDIVHRDLKPENILMDSDGYTRITDLGLATKLNNGLSSPAGTRGYWAPEMLRKDSNGKRVKYYKQVDWFSLGCVVYEFLVGCSPFRTSKAQHWKLNMVPGGPRPTKEERDQAIDLATKEMEPDFDPDVFQDPVTVEFIRALLHKNPVLRLGSNGGDDIRDHAWFEGLDWDQLAVGKPPWKPARNINTPSQQEIGVYCDEKESARVVLTEEDHRRYEIWGFVNSDAFEEEVVMYLRYKELVSYCTILSMHQIHVVIEYARAYILVIICL